MSCETCAGTLMITHVGVPGDHPDTVSAPCIRCLSAVVTPKLREVAREWLGDTTMPWDTCEPPWSVRWESGREFGRWDVVPAHLPAGRDLLMRALAKRVGYGPSKRRRSPWPMGLSWWPERGGWVLSTGMENGYKFTATVGGMPLFKVPTLATIPDDASPDVRAARALVLCWEAYP